MTVKDIEALVRPNIRELNPYSTARDELKGHPDVFLDANESPYPGAWNRYPDPRQKVLKARISAIKGIDADRIFLGNGSDEAIDLVFRVFCIPGKDNAVAIAPSYGMYSVAAQINDVRMHSVQLNEDFSLPADRLPAACDSNTKVIFLCSPNNPSGNAFSNEQIFGLLDAFHGIVVVDEAYIDFCKEPSLIPAIDKYPNLIVLQTFSKARGLAALRLGLAFSNPYVIGVMSMVKYPYNINGSTQKLALECLDKDISAEVKEIVEQREWLSSRLAAIPCVRKVYPSEANFILVKVDDAQSLYFKLLDAGVIVRDRSGMKGCEGCLRITVGLPSENRKVVEIFENYA